jgi:hypothetical protein
MTAMVVPSVTVVIRRKESGILSAKVQQYAADGPVVGRNLLRKKRVTGIERAKVEVTQELADKVSYISWDVVDLV